MSEAQVYCGGEDGEEQVVKCKETETAVFLDLLDQYSGSENGRIINKVDKKVFFKCLRPWPFQSFEIK